MIPLCPRNPCNTITSDTNSHARRGARNLCIYSILQFVCSLSVVSNLSHVTNKRLMLSVTLLQIIFTICKVELVSKRIHSRHGVCKGD